MTHPALTLPPQDCTRCGEPLQLGQTVERDGFGFPSIPPSMWRHSGGADGCIRAAVKQDQRTQRRVAVTLAIAALRDVDDAEAPRIVGFLSVALEGAFDREEWVADDIGSLEQDTTDADRSPGIPGIHAIPSCGHPWQEHGVAGCLVKVDDDYCQCMWVAPGDPGPSSGDREAAAAALDAPAEEPGALS